MGKTIFEQMGGECTQQGDYLLPNLTRLRYLKQHHKILYYNLLTSGKLHSHLADTEKQAQALFLRLVNQLSEREGVTEQLKTENPMEWVRKMNNIRSRVAEAVEADLIFV